MFVVEVLVQRLWAAPDHPVTTAKHDASSRTLRPLRHSPLSPTVIRILRRTVCRIADRQHCAVRLSLLGRGFGQRYRLRIRSAAFSPIMMAAALVLTGTILGMTEASATRRPARPCTRRSGSTTASGPTPMAQLPTG